MKIKVLVVPSLAILSLVLIIGFIKPDYDTLQEQRKILEEKKMEVANIDAVVKNINTLNNSLDSQKETEGFVTRYFPKMLDQGRVIDAMNFLASQSGLLIIGVEINESVKEMEDEDIVLEATPSPLALPNGSALPASVAPYVAPVARSYAATVTAQGSYENIKTFLEKMNRLDRIHSVSLFSVGVNDKVLQASPTEEASSGELIVTFEANFKYLIPQMVGSALSVPVFKEPALKFDVAKVTEEAITGNVPDLNLGETGRANPFQ